jgi:hypothetical protein
LGVTHPLWLLVNDLVYGRINVPMPVLPALMIFDGDLDCVAELALHDLDGRIFALFVLATCAVVGRFLCE